MRLLHAAIGAFLLFSYFAVERATAQGTEIVQAIAPDASPRAGFTRIRVHIVAATPDAAGSISLGSVAVCSARQVCYESGVSSRISLATTSRGTAARLADMEVPLGEFTEVRLLTRGGERAVEGAIALSQPLLLDGTFQGGQILVVLGRSASKDKRLVPVEAVASSYQPQAQYVFYHPGTTTQASLSYGVNITIPEGAQQASQIFTVGIHDTGTSHPLVDIFPRVALKKSAFILFKPIERGVPTTPPGISRQTPAPEVATPAGMQMTARTRSATETRLLSIAATGTHGNLDVDTSAESGGQVAAASGPCNPAGWCNCSDALSFPLNQQIIADGMVPTGTVYLDWCTTIPPYIHIAVSSLADSRERFTIRHDPLVAAFSSDRRDLPLRRLTDWSTYTQVMLNGFTWSGDEGTGPGQYGRAQGYVANFYNTLGVNISTGGPCPGGVIIRCEDYSSGGNKRVMFIPVNGPSPISWLDYSTTNAIQTGSFSYVSSSTSIVKDGVCASDTLTNRWSAVGTTSAGRMIFISSTSAGQTSAAELCSIFLALNSYNAIRLDGGPSAGITIDGTLRNPLTGLAFVKYGTARYVPYALKMSYPGW